MQDINKIWPEWKVDGIIGEGSFGKVYKCVREEFGMTFESAVKVINIPAGMAEYESIRTECNSEAELRSFFEGIVSDFSNEIKLMLMLKGAANIVSVDNYKIVEKTDEFGWKIYIFMEHLTSFVDYCAGKSFTEDEVKNFALDMLNALTICAKSNIIHRDIKPANIFIDRFGSYKLGDFGVARQLESSVSMMSKKGTYNYMAPEVFKGNKYDKRADIYSLGMVMYKLLNNNRDPFIDPHKPMVTYAEKSSAADRRWRGEKLPAPCNASPAMAEIILKAVEFNPENRYADAAEFKAAVLAADKPVYQNEPTVAANDYFEQTVAARDFELPLPSAVNSAYGIGDEPTTFADDEPTQFIDYNPTVFADDGATVMANDEPTVFAENTNPEPIRKVPTVIKKIAEYQITGETKQAEKKITSYRITGEKTDEEISAPLGCSFKEQVQKVKSTLPVEVEAEAEAEEEENGQKMSAASIAILAGVAIIILAIFFGFF